MNLAESLCMSVARCKREVSSSEFIRWIAKWELDALDREHAQREAEMRAR